MKIMKIQYLSDLHLERKIDYLDLVKSVVINKNNADILVLAGDILNFSLNEYEYSDIFQYFSENWEYTLYIPGNHEYYNNYYPLSLEPIEIQLKDNVFFFVITK
jgi:predicted MPP superfamily phosphohydrolase